MIRHKRVKLQLSFLEVEVSIIRRSSQHMLHGDVFRSCPIGCKEVVREIDSSKSSAPKGSQQDQLGRFHNLPRPLLCRAPRSPIEKNIVEIVLLDHPRYRVRRTSTEM